MDSWFLNAVSGTQGNERHQSHDPLRRLCLGKLRNIPVMVVCILVILGQSYFLNELLVKVHKGDRMWWLWFISDGVAILIFVTTFYIREWRIAALNNYRADSTGFQKGLPLSWIAWLFYTVMLVVRIALMYRTDMRDEAQQSLVQYSDDSPGGLQFSISLSAVVSLLFTIAHHHDHESLARRATIIILSKNFVIDILDSTDILGLLLEKQMETKGELPVVLENIVLTVMAFSLMHPAFVKICLFLDHFTTKYHSLGMKIGLAFVDLLLLNIPLLIIRVYIAITYHDEISVFLVKNITSIIYYTLEIYDCFYDRYLEKQMEQRERQEQVVSYRNSTDRKFQLQIGNQPIEYAKVHSSLGNL